MNKKVIIVEKSKKLSAALQDFGFTYADVNKMLRAKDVRINKKVQKSDVVLNVGDELCFFYSDNMLEKKFERVYDGKEAVVIYKYAGIESQGALEQTLHATAVHRLDRNTEGLMVYAKSENAQKSLEKAFKNKKIHKFYVAEVAGKFETDKTYSAYLLKDIEKAYVKIFQNKVNGSTQILTKIKTLSAGQESSLVEIELLTGKTHQIRAHLAYLGHAIIGDGKYGKNEINKKFKENKQKLACFKLIFEDVGVEELNFKEFICYPSWFKSKK